MYVVWEWITGRAAVKSLPTPPYSPTQILSLLILCFEANRCFPYTEQNTIKYYQFSCSKLCSLKQTHHLLQYSMQCTDHDGVSCGDHRVSGGDELVTTSSPVSTGSGRRGRRWDRGRDRGRDRGLSRLWWWRPLWSDCVHSQTHTTSLLTVVYTKNQIFELCTQIHTAMLPT